MPLTKSQFAPYDLYDNLTLESFVRGLATQKAQVRTRHKHIVATDVYSGNGCRHVSRTDRPPLPARRWKVWSWFGKRKLAEDTMIHMLSSDFHLSRLASTSKEEEIMVLHHTQGWYMHQGSKLIYFQFLLFLTSWRELCGLSAVKSWKMLAKIFPENIVPRLQAIYDKVGGWSN